MNSLTKIAATLALMAAVSGNLPRILSRVRLVQIKLIKESQASEWGKPFLRQGIGGVIND
jgi:ribonuclease D